MPPLRRIALLLVLRIRSNEHSINQWRVQTVSRVPYSPPPSVSPAAPAQGTQATYAFTALAQQEPPQAPALAFVAGGSALADILNVATGQLSQLRLPSAIIVTPEVLNMTLILNNETAQKLIRAGGIGSGGPAPAVGAGGSTSANPFASALVTLFPWLGRRRQLLSVSDLLGSVRESVGSVAGSAVGGAQSHTDAVTQQRQALKEALRAYDVKRLKEDEAERSAWRAAKAVVAQKSSASRRRRLSGPIEEGAFDLSSPPPACAAVRCCLCASACCTALRCALPQTKQGILNPS